VLVDLLDLTFASRASVWRLANVKSKSSTSQEYGFATTLTTRARRGPNLHKAEFAQYPPHCFRHGSSTGRRLLQVARCVFCNQVAPALKCPMRPRLNQNDLGIKYKRAAPDPVLVAKWPDIEKPLTAGDFAADHPIKRAAIGEFPGTLRHHPRAMDVLWLAAALASLLALLPDPILKITHGIASDAQFYEMKRHTLYFIRSSPALSP
jgi:hypothetical protein